MWDNLIEGRRGKVRAGGKVRHAGQRLLRDAQARVAEGHIETIQNQPFRQRRHGRDR